MNLRVYHIIWIFWVLIILFSFLQFYEKPIKVKALDASHIHLEKPEFRINSCLNGALQDTVIRRHTLNFPFRASFVRVHNQLEYSLFDNIAANKKSNKILRVHKHSFPILFHNEYVKAYTGNKWFDQKKLKDQIAEIKLIQERFEEKGIHFLYLFAPNKVAFYPELFDKENYPKGKYPRLYDFTKQKMDEYAINYIDYHNWFFDLKKGKDSTKVFSNVGTHWSLYGASLVTDSLLRYLKGRNFVEIDSVQRERYTSEETIYPDNDVQGMMNLLYPLKQAPMYYFKRKKDHPIIPLSFSTVGDSFWWQIWSKNSLAKSLTPNHYFMYYGNTVYQKKDGKNIDRKGLSSEKKFELMCKGKLVICISTEHTIPKVINGLLKITNHSKTKNAN